MSGNDILNLGTILGLLQGQGGNQDGLIRNCCGHLLEFGQATMDRGCFLENCPGFKVHIHWKWFESGSKFRLQFDNPAVLYL
jgi:hypothetical protein